MSVQNSRRRRIAAVVTGLIVCAAVAGGTQQARAQAADVPLAPELNGLGTLHVTVTTQVPRAQLFFDQGMRLLYAFNHTESIRAFREAARLDPGLAMAYWGEALALGPNLNAPMTPDNGRLAYAAVQQAMERRSRSSSRERVLIEALATRYAADGAGDRPVLDRLYATAMQTVATRFADDPDLATLYADARMNTMPWDYWQKDGTPKTATAEVLALLESTIARNPDHPGALHYHIHVLEASKDPDRAERSADRLGSLMPAAGHIVHMPAHIYIRVGRYADAAEANERAIEADEDYLSQCQAQGLYPVSYYPHNLHFLWAAATLEGRKVVAVEAARKVAAKVPHHHAGALAWTADFPVTPMLAYARFGLWQDALTEPRPPAKEPYATGIWHYARGLAFIARNQPARAASELAALKSVMKHEAFASTLKDLPLLTNLQIASLVVEGELAALRGDADNAIRVLREAVAIEDGMPYSEPPIWHQPTRQVLGALLLEAGRATEAEEVYRHDLKIFRENGWSLFGLMESLKAQLHRSPEAAEVERRFEKAWARADVKLMSSRIGKEEAQESVTHEVSPHVVINDNTHSAGSRQGDSLVLTLRAGVGLWHPEGEKGPALEIEAFGEGGGPLQAPAPLIRVPEGTTIVASVRNDLDHTLRVHGLCAHDGTPCAPIELSPSSERQVRFTTGRAGTYHYWATTTQMPLSFRAASDTQLSGAFIVDAPGGSAADRVLVITDWTSVTRDQLTAIASADDPGKSFLALEPRLTFLINGLSWPATERLRYRLGEQVRWRVVNLSSQSHPMHLHGFYFTIDGFGDGMRDESFDESRKQRVVTRLMTPGTTMAMAWRPEREGNWLFHCHISDHVSPERRLTEDAGSHEGHHGAHDRSAGMAGMILGVTVDGGDGPATGSADTNALPARTLTLVMQSEPAQYGANPAYGFALSGDGEAPASAKISVPGPTLVLRRGEPVEIALVNRLSEATAIHWHGMELDSYYDGVHGWSGIGNRVTPLIEPGATFAVRFTPSRTGTFIYHTHLHDDRQLTSGMYGALLVLEPGETFNPELDHVVVIGRGGPGRDAPAILNGSRDQEFVWSAGALHRVRFINITPGDIFVTSLATATGPVDWRPLTKDGAPVPAGEGTPRPATQTMAVGETFDFTYQAPARRQTLWLNVRTPGGRWMVQGRVAIKPEAPN